MLDLGDIGLRIGRLATFALGAAFVWFLGLAIANLRGPRPSNVIWYDGAPMAVGMFGIPFGVAAILARLARVEGWDSDVVWWLAGCCFLATAVMALIVFRYRLTVLDEALIEQRVFRPGARRVEWSAVSAWKMGRKAGSVILILTPAGKFEFATINKVGLDVFADALEARGIPAV